MLSNAVFSWKHIQTHTLDKNGSLYDPAGTESWNMQIRYETTKLTKHPTNNRSSPEWFPCPVKDWAGTWIERPQSISLCNRCVFVGWRHLKHTPSPCIKIRKGEDKGRKREKFYIYLDVTHTHTRPEPGQPWKARGRKKRTHDGQTAKNSAGGGGEQTDPPEPTYTAKRTWPKQRTHLNPTTHYGEARGEKLGTKWGTSWNRQGNQNN